MFSKAPHSLSMQEYSCPFFWILHPQGIPLTQLSASASNNSNLAQHHFILPQVVHVIFGIALSSCFPQCPYHMPDFPCYLLQECLG